jgi:CDP-diacylglycerol--inositol 3-phosphatidyltransferase
MNPNPVFFYYPNILGYARILLAFLSFFTMTTKPFQASIYYFISAFLDAFDGFLARKYKQGLQLINFKTDNSIEETLFGAMLDQLTDRCAFLGLLMVLCMFYPNYFYFFQFVAVL